MFKAIGTIVTEVDMEWVELFQEAIALGLSIEEIREFFKTGQP